MDILSVTTFADIRAVLGVSIEELDDATLSLDVYALNLEAELRDLGPTLVSDYEGVLLRSPSLWSPAERWFSGMTKLFGTYAVAKHLLASLPLFSPKEITDGKAAMVRYAADPYKATIKAIEAQYAQARTRVLDAYGSVGVKPAQAYGSPVLMVGGPALYDPVTGT